MLALLTIMLVAVAALSLQWRLLHDAAYQMYLAYLSRHFHKLPYRDVFEENLPGTHVIYGLVGRLAGYGDFGFRCADVAYLAAIAAVSWFWMKGLGRRVAWCGAVLFGLAYFERGPVISMQRDYLLLLPLVTALLVSSRTLVRHEGLGSAAVGALIGFSAMIKPHAAMALPIVVVFRAWDVVSAGGAAGRKKPLYGIPAAALLGFLAPAAGYYCYLARIGALRQFLDVAKNYWPLYRSLTGYHTTIEGLPRIKYLLANYFMFGGRAAWFVPAACGASAALFSAPLRASQRRQVYLLAALACCFSLYALLAGKFWPYHWLPFAYFMMQLSALCLVDRPGARSGAVARLPAAVLFVTVVLMVRPPEIFYHQASGRPIPPPKGGRIDEIAAYLKARLREGDTVQPLDWTGGAIPAMLIARAELATSFYYDVPFYHHVSSGYVQGLRRRFIGELAATAPRFIIRVETDKPWVSGPDTTREFRELQIFLDAEYQPAFMGMGYVIYERRPGMGAPAAL